MSKKNLLHATVGTEDRTSYPLAGAANIKILYILAKSQSQI